jgi:predicted O-methyltransferase YrrM
MIKEMELLKDSVLNNIRILAPLNKQDYYYSEIMNLATRDYFFETYNVIHWYACRYHPKHILEIGTRNGGSLVQLLSAYQEFDQLSVVCFDLWREIGSPKKVKSNLEKLNIPITFIEFISGDSTQTVPEYFRKHPDRKFDYVLVDGGHESEVARADLENVVDRIAPGGFLIFDDIGPESYKLDHVWQAFKTSHKDELVAFEKYWRKGVAWAFRKESS